MNCLGLAVEAEKLLTKADGAVVRRKNAAGVRVTDVILEENAAKRIGKLKGRYITLEGERDLPQMTLIFEKALKEFIGEKKRIFIAGLGNPDITHDSLGAEVIKGVVPIKGHVSAIETDVAARTGVDTARLVRGAAREMNAQCVIAIDSLACEDPRRIGKTVQLSDTGFVLGSGVGENAGEISERFLGVPTIAVGVPTMTALSSVCKKCSGDFLVTSSDIYIIIKEWSVVISQGVNAVYS